MSKKLYILFTVALLMFHNLNAEEVKITATAEGTKDNKLNIRFVDEFSNTNLSQEELKLQKTPKQMTNLASTKVNCDKVEFNLNPVALVTNMIDSVISEVTSFMKSTETTPGEMVELFVNSVVGSVCLMANPQAAIEAMQDAQACLGKLKLPSMEMGGDAGLANNYVYPVPVASGSMSMNIDVEAAKASGKCFAQIASQKNECKSGSKSPKCTFLTCYHNTKKEFFKILNTKIKSAPKASGATDKLKIKQCEFKKKKDNRILDAMNMNPRDKKSWTNSFRNSLAGFGITSDKLEVTEDMTDIEKKKLEAYEKDMASRANRNSLPAQLEAKKAAEKAYIEELKDKACGINSSKKNKKDALPKIRSLNKNTFNLSDENLLQKAQAKFKINDLLNSVYTNRMLTNEVKYLKLELYRYLMGFRKNQTFTFIDADKYDRTTLNEINKNELIYLENSEFLKLPNWNNDYLSARNKVLFAQKFCSVIRDTPIDTELYKIFLFNLNETTKKLDHNIFRHFNTDDFSEKPTYNSTLNKTQFLRNKNIVKEITYYITDVICENIDRIHMTMMQADKMKDLDLISTSNTKKYLDKKNLIEDNKKATDNSLKGDIDTLNQDKPFAKNIEAMMNSWKEAGNTIEKNNTEMNSWIIKR